MTKITKTKRNRKIACECSNNFYITLPKAFSKDLVNYENNKFTTCCVKCGEMQKESFEARYTATKYAGGMEKLYDFYIEPSKISKNATKDFDKPLFGFQNLKIVYNTTIWKFGEKKVKPRPKDDYGTEYIDIANLVNYWLDETDKAILNNAEIEAANTNNQNIMIKAIILVLKGLLEKNFCQMVAKYSAEISSKKTKKKVELFSHQAHILAEIYKMCNSGKRNIIAQLPPRFGKTLTWLTLFNESMQHRLMIVTSYVKTVGASYIKEALNYEDFADMQIVNIDNCEDFKYNGGKIVIEMPTTGNENTISRRVDIIKKIIKAAKIKSNEIFLVNEEADFGNHTDKANTKFESLIKSIDKKFESLVISTTGTDAFKAEKITAFGKIDGYISVNNNAWEQIILG